MCNALNNIGYYFLTLIDQFLSVPVFSLASFLVQEFSFT